MSGSIAIECRTLHYTRQPATNDDVNKRTTAKHQTKKLARLSHQMALSAPLVQPQAKSERYTESRRGGKKTKTRGKHRKMSSQTKKTYFLCSLPVNNRIERPDTTLHKAKHTTRRTS